MDNISSKTTIAKNTTLLYGRTALIMFVSLFTSRVILQALGVEDYGIYSAIGGVVSLLTVVTGPIDGAISRFLTFELGRGDKDRLKRYFSAGMTIMLIFSILAIVILETVGLWFLNHKMVISEERLMAANWVLHLSIASFVISLLASPYRASLIAHERMSLFAYLGILDVFLKLGVAFLIKFSAFDKLILYALLLLLVSIIVRVIYTVVCNREFEECSNPRIFIDKELFGGLFSFAGWNMFGAAAGICHGQGINILFNLFGGPVVNAAYGIANQVNGAVGSFVNNFTTALNPSIIKSYAAERKEYMMSLIYQGAKYSYCLVFLFALPLLLETEYITKLWLGQTPEHSVVFIQLMLVHSMIESLSKTIMAGTHASGKIRTYQIVVGCMLIAILPLSYLVLRLGYPPESALWVTIIIDIMALFVRALLARCIFGLSIRVFVTKVLLVTILVTLVAIPLPIYIRVTMDESIERFLVVLVTCVIATVISVLFVGCTPSERNSIFSKIKQIATKNVTNKKK